MSKTRAIIALGGNAILNKGDKGTYEDQKKNVDENRMHMQKAMIMWLLEKEV